MPNIYKIGFTTISPYFRANQLSGFTSCPTPFDVVCFAEFVDAHASERKIHEQFSDYRISTSKEFFKFNLEDLITYATYCICSPEESSCIDSFYTEKYQYFLSLFHKDVSLV